MNRPWSGCLYDAPPYVAGEQPKGENTIKLNANENPYPPSPAVIETINSFDAATVKKYPDANADKVREVLADHHGLKKENIFVGNGSDDVLGLSFRAFFNSGKPIFFPDITYSFYPVWCRLIGIPYKEIPTDENFRIDPDDYKPENGGVILPNPNAPTSIGEGRDFVVRLLENNRDVIVIIDEAYADFGNYSAVELLGEYENLIITQTMSKSRSMAGMRVAAAMGSEELISVLLAAKDSFNSYPVNRVSQAAAIASVKDEGYFREIISKVKATRGRLTDGLRALGFNVFDSSTNFVFCTHPKVRAEHIMDELKTKGIYIRRFALPRIDNYLRITVGTDEQTDILLSEIKNILGSSTV
ncbi:MAG: histidinol-phosphate transaminase [Oscillospiraceae bacterium]|nr:histidinol-phosphate transaminase [Oscillospiraceae bacterium]